MKGSYVVGSFILMQYAWTYEFQEHNLKIKCQSNDIDCVFQSIETHNFDVSYDLTINSVDSVPDYQKWSYCENCVYTGIQQHFTALYDRHEKDNKINNQFKVDEKIEISSSQWHEFFSMNNDKYYIEFMDHTKFVSQYQSNELIVIDRPVFILPMITYHVGHLFVDVLEQLYSMMIDQYGTIRLDSILLIDVAGAAERNILQTKLSYYTNITNDLFGVLQTYFTDMPILSTATFFNQLNTYNQPIIFRHLHIGMNLTYSHYTRGYFTHPCIYALYESSSTSSTCNSSFLKATEKMKCDSNHNDGGNTCNIHINQDTSKSSLPDLYSNINIYELSIRYRAFQHYLWSQSISILFPKIDFLTIPTPWKSTFQQLNLLFIQRDDNRIILNLNDIASTLQIKYQFRTIIRGLLLEYVPFSEQLEAFMMTDILIALAGSTFHNVLFMRPGTVIVIIMQQGWCKWSWMYANQAILLGIRPVIICMDDYHHGNTDYSSTNETDIDISHEKSVYTDEVSFNTLNIHDIESYVHVYVDKTTSDYIQPGESSFHLSHQFYHQGPLETKLENIHISHEIVENILLGIHQQMREFYEKYTYNTYEEWLYVWNKHFYPQPLCIPDLLKTTKNPKKKAKKNQRTKTKNIANNQYHDLITCSSNNTTNVSITVMNDLFHTDIGNTMFHHHYDTHNHNNNNNNNKSHRTETSPHIYMYDRNNMNNSHDDDSNALSIKKTKKVTLSDLYELYISSVSWNYIENDMFDSLKRRKSSPNPQVYELHLYIDIIDKTYSNYQLFQEYINISICVKMLFTSTTTHICAPISQFNYYSDLRVYFIEPVQYIQLYLQLQPDDDTTKIIGSDTYVVVDTRIDQSAGFQIHENAIGVHVHYYYTLPSSAFFQQLDSLDSINEYEAYIRLLNTNTVSYTTNIASHIDVTIMNDTTTINDSTETTVSNMTIDKMDTTQNRYDDANTNRIDPTTDTKNLQIEVNMRVHTKYSIQYYIRYICHTHNLSVMQCGHFLIQYIKQIYRQYEKKKYDLNRIQIYPSTSDPFVFLHIDKCAGTTLRELIAESADALNLTYIIPCYGKIHCATVDSQHLYYTNYTSKGHQITTQYPVPVSLQNVSIVAGHFAWGIWNKVFPYYHGQWCTNCQQRQEKVERVCDGNNNDHVSDRDYDRYNYQSTINEILDNLNQTQGPYIHVHDADKSAATTTTTANNDKQMNRINLTTLSYYYSQPLETLSSPSLSSPSSSSCHSTSSSSSSMTAIQQTHYRIFGLYTTHEYQNKVFLPLIYNRTIHTLPRVIDIYENTENYHTMNYNPTFDISTYMNLPIEMSPAATATSIDNTTTTTTTTTTNDLNVSATSSVDIYNISHTHDSSSSTTTATTTTGSPIISDDLISTPINMISIQYTNITYHPQIPTCFILYRHPIDRIISYYYQRCYISTICQGYHKSMNQLSGDEFRQIVEGFRSGATINFNRGDKKYTFFTQDKYHHRTIEQDHINNEDDYYYENTPSDTSINTETVIVDDGISDAACKVLSDTRTTTGIIYGGNMLLPYYDLSEYDIQKALYNSNQCIVGFQEEWNVTKLMINEWLPWIHLKGDNQNRYRMKTDIHVHVFADFERETKDTLRSDLYEILIEYNTCDMKLYENMRQRFEIQRHVLHYSNTVLDKYFTM